MEIDFENDEGLKLFDKILIEEEYIKTGVEDLFEEQLDRIGIMSDNIMEISLG